MGKTTLYIIGNGFDRAHNLPTSYICFYNYLKGHHNNMFISNLNDIFPELDDNKENWHHFEAQLSNFIVDSDINDGIKDDLKTLEYYDEGFDDYELVPTFIDAHLKKYNDTIVILRQKFRDWITDVMIENSTPIYKFADNSIFLNFNYTLTLEILYGISESKVHHIHGKVGDKELIIGHSWDYNVTVDSIEGRFIETPDGEVLDTLEEVIIEKSEAKQIIQQYDSSESNKRIFNEFRHKIISPLQKNCSDIIESSNFFNKLENLKIKEIYVLGHSLSEVDMPYFHELNESVSSECLWNIVYYADDKDRNRNAAISAMKVMGIDEERYRLLTWDEYESHAGIHNTAK
ncbi:bacteriophage abortive infection AbiH family protein [Bacteroides neonati]|uniref:bacteriophage abortive infection AbiH family protein n=1 Tax=Bacteroides neonati TaxID=1347393 RepID=UPI0004AF2063|nr:bacteriophage abortive infection AbiH family protein [Bacteroides neonati]